MIIEAWRNAERVHRPGCNADDLREERERVCVPITEKIKPKNMRPYKRRGP